MRNETASESYLKELLLLDLGGAGGRTRTSDHRVNSPALYLAELPRHQKLELLSTYNFYLTHLAILEFSALA